MKILIITRSAWDDSNSIGNTMTNLFSGYPIENLANLYVRRTMPNNSVCNEYYTVSDQDIFKSIFNPSFIAGKAFSLNSCNEYKYTDISKHVIVEEQIYDYFRKKSSVLAFWGQNLLWSTGSWQNRNLDNFLMNFKPDVIFSPCFHTRYTHKILWYIQKKTNAKVVLFHADDYLSINSKNLSLLEKIDQRKRSKVVESSAVKADINYCISRIQLEEYQLKLGIEMKLLFKGAKFSTRPEYSTPEIGKPIKIVYIGSILYGRWKTLSLLAEKISRINKEKTRFILDIYSQYTANREMLKKMEISDSSYFKGKIQPHQIKEIFLSSDIVLHIESFDEIEKQRTRLSFSTKIVDCFSSGRAILAIGWDKSASIKYLIENEAAFVAKDESEIDQVLHEIDENPLLISEFATKSWDCGKKNHQIEEIQRNLMTDIKNIRGTIV